MKTLEYHPIANSFPWMEKDEYESFKSGFSHGYDARHPITLFEGKILDGRHRQKVCLELGLEPTYEDFHVNGQSEVEFVVNENLNRRHLKTGQRACVAAILSNLNKQDPKVLFQKNVIDKGLAHVAGSSIKNKTPKEEKESLKRKNENRTLVQMASKMNVGHNTTAKAYALFNNQKRLFDQVYAGARTLESAYSEYRNNHGFRKKNTECSLMNIEQFKTKIIIPNCFDARQVIDDFIKTMNAHGWILEMQFNGGYMLANWFGNGFSSVRTNWGQLSKEHEFRRAVIVAAKEKLDKVKQPKQLKA